MNLKFIATLFAAAFLSTAAHAYCTGSGCPSCEPGQPCPMDADDVAKSVVCKVKDVTALTASEADCTTIGGKAVKEDKK